MPALALAFNVLVTVTVCVPVLVLLCVSVTVHVIVVNPNGNVDGELFVTLCMPQLSPVIGTPRLTPVAAQPELLTGVLTFGGAVIVGFSLSVTVTSNVVFAAPHSLVASTVTMVVPTGKICGEVIVVAP